MISRANIPNALTRTTRLNGGGLSLRSKEADERKNYGAQDERPASHYEALYKQFEAGDEQGDSKAADWSGLFYDTARLLAPSEKSSAFVDSLEKRSKAPAKAAQERLLKKIELAKVVDESKTKAYEFDKMYVQKDKEIATKALRYANKAGETSVLPIDPKTGAPFPDKEAYKAHLRMERDSFKEELAEKRHQAKADMDYVKLKEQKHSAALPTLVKSRDAASRLVQATEAGADSPFSEGGGRINKLFQEYVVAPFSGKTASTIKDMSELAQKEEVSDVGSRSSVAMAKLYAEIKPNLDDPREIANYKFTLKQKIEDAQINAPLFVAKIIAANPKLSKKQAYEMYDEALGNMANELQMKYNKKQPIADVTLRLPDDAPHSDTSSSTIESKRKLAMQRAAKVRG